MIAGFAGRPASSPTPPSSHVVDVQRPHGEKFLDSEDLESATACAAGRPKHEAP